MKNKLIALGLMSPVFVATAIVAYHDPVVLGFIICIAFFIMFCVGAAMLIFGEHNG